MLSESNGEQNLAKLRISRNFLIDGKSVIKFVFFAKTRIKFQETGNFFIIAEKFAA